MDWLTSEIHKGYTFQRALFSEGLICGAEELEGSCFGNFAMFKSLHWI